jgi:cytochrome P450
MYRCHEKYGSYVRYGPNALLFNTPTALKVIYSNSSASNYIKGDAYAPLIHRAPNTLTIRGGKEHARRRRIMAQGVSEKAQRGYEARVIRHIEEFCNNTVQRGSGQKENGSWSEPMDMSKWS